MEELRRIETKIEQGQERDERRYETMLGRIEQIWASISAINQNMASVKEKGDSTQRLAISNETRIRELERSKNTAHGMWAVIVLLLSAAFNWVVQRFTGGS